MCSRTLLHEPSGLEDLKFRCTASLEEGMVKKDVSAIIKSLRQDF
jgi:hypothetical protein